MEEIVVESSWRDKLARDAREIRLIAAVIACVVLGSLLLWARRAPARIAPPARATETPIASASPAILVHVAGLVRRPGLYEFPAGARIADAIETAGGARPGADLTAVNLAAPLTDGTQVLIPRRSAFSGSVSNGSASAGTVVPGPEPSAAQVVNINSADQTALETIPGIGPVTAAAIVQHRTDIGGFSSVDELLDVDGIGPATLEAIRPYVAL